MISEKAVEAAWRAYYDALPCMESDQIRAALSAALPVLLEEIAREAKHIAEQAELTMTGRTSRLNVIRDAAYRIINGPA